MIVTKRDGVYFIEGTHPSFMRIKSISTQLNSGFSQDQLKSLNDVKDVMIRQAREAGGNCIAEFKYGQRSGGFWAQMWSLDNCLWYGGGVIGTLSQEAIAQVAAGPRARMGST